MPANILVIGGGGREHAITWCLSQSAKVEKIFAAPGSFAIAQLPKAENIPLDINNFEELAKWCKSNKVTIVAVGPEDPLANGIADALNKHGILVFGPEKEAAKIESNKDWAKAFMDRHNVPTAKWRAFTDAKEAKNFINSAPFPALVVKASGLAAGKGVVVAADKKQACEAVDFILTNKKFGVAGDVVVIEELLQGEEVSVLAFTDGTTVKAMLPAQDHKRIFNNDLGPNTGGMGAYCPCPLLSDDQMKFVQDAILQRTIDGLQKEKIKFVGVLYAGLMLTPEGPKVIEFNCRFGDPETEVILPLLESDLFEVMHSCCVGSLRTVDLRWKQNLSVVGVVMASRGYPETSAKGQIISGIDQLGLLKDHVVFHCGSAIKDGNIVTNGGRVLIAVAMAPQLAIAAAKATAACSIIRFEGEQHRTDIAHKGIAKAILSSGKLTYKASGVDITAGNDLVDHIKPCAKSTNRPGVMGGLGGFGGLFDTKLAGYKDPLLVSGTDGVGTKLKIAQEMGIHDTIGIDLVAMCVNDVLAHGAEPLFFLDYYACGSLDVHVAKQVVSGVAEGCRQAGCALVGGETAEMPDMYPSGDYDVAGFAVGAVERSHLMPHIDQIIPGDTIIALPSSGVHSNGFSLVRKIMKVAGVTYKDKAPFSATGKSFGEELLTPTQIYIKAVVPAVRTSKVKAFAHITGGGLTENIPRVLTTKLGVKLDALKWKMPAVFPWLATAGGVNQVELLRTFNCGVGGILIVNKSDEVEMLNMLKPYGATVIGSVFARDEGTPDVIVDNFGAAMEPLMKTYVPEVVKMHSTNKKRVGVLISGSGTNLQALIDATEDVAQHMGAEIALVISNKDGVEGLKRAERAGIPTKVISLKNFNGSREDCDMAMQMELVKAQVDFICLAGFMRVLTEKFTNLWHGKMINIHPALLPLFKGTHGARQALEAGVRVTGCTVHFVEADIDSGAILVQETVPIEVGDTEETLQERLRPVEHRAYTKALRLLATGKARLGSDNKIQWS